MSVAEQFERPDRRARGAWATPPWLVDHVLDLVLEPALAGRSSLDGFTLLDPACGDGRFLEAAARRLARHFGVTRRHALAHVMGIEVHGPTASEAARRLGRGARVEVGDFLSHPLPHAVDVVIGNPPYLSQLAALTSRGGSSRLGGGPYADAAVEFLAVALRVARSDGGRVGLVLPQSVLASRDAEPLRADALRLAALDSLWWAGQAVFDAAVHTMVVGFVRGSAQTVVHRTAGAPPHPLAPIDASDLAEHLTWSHLVADAAGVPPVAPATEGRLADWADATAGFRDQFYGLAPFVVEDDDPPSMTDAPLVTCGLLEPGRCGWGTRAARFAGRVYQRPNVDIDTLAASNPRLARWVQARRRPKVLVATQTRVLEAAVDEAGTWVPSVPVLSVEPHPGVDPWLVGALLSSPVTSVVAATAYLGAGLGATSLKLSARQVLALPRPVGALDEAAAQLRAGDLDGAAQASMRAYGVDDPAVLAWWRAGVSGPRRRRAPANAG